MEEGRAGREVFSALCPQGQDQHSPKCPNCAGTLPLGVDKCDYCGQIVVT